MLVIVGKVGGSTFTEIVTSDPKKVGAVSCEPATVKVSLPTYPAFGV